MQQAVRRLRESMGTTRKGQVLLGFLGLAVGVACGLGLRWQPSTFEPLLRFALYAVSKVLGGHIHYVPTQRVWFEVGLPVLGLVWALLFARAFLREPGRNRVIDAHLWRQQQIAQEDHTRLVRQDDSPD